MKKLLMATALAAVAILGASSFASATITSPAIGGTVRGSGTVTFRGTIISTSCDVIKEGVVIVGDVLRADRIIYSNCGAGATITPLGLPWTARLTLSPDTFTLSVVQVALTAPIVGTCLYSGSITGTYTVGANTTLTITGDTLTKVSGSSLCTSNPVVTGTIRTTATTV